MDTVRLGGQPEIGIHPSHCSLATSETQCVRVLVKAPTDGIVLATVITITIKLGCPCFIAFSLPTRISLCP